MRYVVCLNIVKAFFVVGHLSPLIESQRSDNDELVYDETKVAVRFARCRLVVMYGWQCEDKLDGATGGEVLSGRVGA